MASLHAATGFPVADDGRVFATSNHNPFLKPASAPPPPLRPANQAAKPAASLEVTVLWGSNVLAVAQLTPPRAYAVGEVGAPGKHGIAAGKIVPDLTTPGGPGGRGQHRWNIDRVREQLRGVAREQREE